jgi:hypothetical protein
VEYGEIKLFGDPEDVSEIFLQKVSDFERNMWGYIPEDRNHLCYYCENLKCEKLRNVRIA